MVSTKVATPSPQQSYLHLNPVIEKLSQGKHVFGVSTSDFSLQNARSLARDPDIDFVYLDMEHGAMRFDQLESYAVGKNGTTSDMYAFKHPAMFPENLARDHILSWSDPGDLVFDPMCGAGTTCKMAKATGRRWLGVDVSREYTSIAELRVKETEEGALSSLPSRTDPFDEPVVSEDLAASSEDVGLEEPVSVCCWCGNEIPALRTQLTGGRAITCSPECSDFNNRRRQHELRAADCTAPERRRTTRA